MSKPGAIKPEDLKIKGQIGKRGLAVLLRVQEIVSTNGKYSYVEVGSYLGRTLQPHVMDSDCKAALSIDLRPDVTPDERGALGMYKGIRAEDMLDELKAACTATQVKKVTTITDSSDALRTYSGRRKYDLALIDGEHTNTAVFQDFLNLRRVMNDDCVICFDDTHIVHSGIVNAKASLEDAGIPHAIFFCKGAITVLAIGALAPVLTELLDPDLQIRPGRAERRYRANIADNIIANEMKQRLTNNPDLRASVAKILAKIEADAN